ncbi:phosphoadenylyl-sulfate reductase [Fulvivirga kasyanovii]|uniref:Adenosine 5'-phosphosulfate reductase n=1 Tax=Fulvivirga kasyanovii TaxID=396812 RepID=A0ABW9RXD7_9BACT|nr:phosphoadenylyl-sulfate reductase [Fulvivirga kasyanovii]MTI28696.1 phosphoadenylyl-sulfate reductase [Fulvivirga kasyanovii]
MNIQEANGEYESLSPEERLKKLFQSHPSSEILVTSSFGSTSVVLLHMINKIQPGHPIYFIDTTFHFDETLDFKDRLIRQLDLNVINVKARSNKNKFTHDNKTWKYNPDLCCYINKVEPLDQIKKSFKFWISGLMAYQNENRKNIDIFQPKDELIKFHPLIDMSPSEVALYQLIHELPIHPLTGQGYSSIGCFNCTKKGAGRSGRWADMAKTECGLHA